MQHRVATPRATWSTPSEPSHKKPFFDVLSFPALFGPGCCCQLVCFEFGVLYFRLPLYTRKGQVGENKYSCCGSWLWSWLAAAVNLFVLNMLCFISVCLYLKRADCRTRTYREETKKTLPRRPGHVAPRGAFSCRCAHAAILNATSFHCTYRGFPAALLSRSCPAPGIFTSTKASKHQSRRTRTHILWKYYPHMQI